MRWMLFFVSVLYRLRSNIIDMKYCLPCIVILFISCTGDSGTIKIKGSDTEVNLAVQLAEAFHSFNPGVFVSISGGGSGLGIASLLNGTADIANSSRGIKDSEIEMFKKKDVAGIDSFVFAQDAIAFVVAANLPIDSISTIELAKLLGGYYKNWLQLTGLNMPVNIYGRQSNSGTYEFVKTKLEIEFSPYAKQMSGNAQILEAIRADQTGIGYVGAGYVMQGSKKGIKVLSIYGVNENAVSPLDSNMIAAGKYYFQRPLFQYYKKGSYKKIKSFLDFEKSPQGKSIIHAAGYYPVK